jgi:arylsulfatase A-like enzyme
MHGSASVLLLAIALGTSTDGDGSPPNVLFLLTDDQRPDTISALGNQHINTPNLDLLVRRGTAFTRAVCPYPICTPSRAEILTGCSSFENGVFDFGGRMDPSRVTWPTAMRSAGYRTWYVGKWHNDGWPTDHGYQETLGLYGGGGGRWAKDAVDWKGVPVTGYRGWVFRDDAKNLYPERGVGLTPEISGDFADAAIALIRRQPEQPFFLHVNFTAPHDPLWMPPGYEERYRSETIPLPGNFLPKHPFDHGNLEGRDERLLPWPRTRQMVRELTAMYYAVISHLDAQIGRILMALEETGQFDCTLVIFASDHGVALGSHGLRGKQNMYEHTIGVPLVFCGPGVPHGQRCDAPVYLRDIYPTVCEFTGIAIPRTVTGQSFAAVLRGEADEVHREIFCYFRDKQRMIRSNRWKLIRYPSVDRWQLFDLQNDPLEREDQSENPQYADVRLALEAKLRSAQRAAGDPLLEREEDSQ